MCCKPYQARYPLARYRRLRGHIGKGMDEQCWGPVIEKVQPPFMIAAVDISLVARTLPDAKSFRIAGFLAATR